MLSEIGKGSKRMLKAIVSHLNTRVCWGGPAPKSGTPMDHSIVNRSTMEQASLLQPVVAGREVKREPGADGTGVG